MTPRTRISGRAPLESSVAAFWTQKHKSFAFLSSKGLLLPPGRSTPTVTDGATDKSPKLDQPNCIRIRKKDDPWYVYRSCARPTSHVMISIVCCPARMTKRRQHCRSPTNRHSGQISRDSRGGSPNSSRGPSAPVFRLQRSKNRMRPVKSRSWSCFRGTPARTGQSA